MKFLGFVIQLTSEERAALADLRAALARRFEAAFDDGL